MIACKFSLFSNAVVFAENVRCRSLNEFLFVGFQIFDTIKCNRPKEAFENDVPSRRREKDGMEMEGTLDEDYNVKIKVIVS